MTFRNALMCALCATFLAILPLAPADAYIGPGAGMSAVGSVLAIIAALAAAVFGFVWYPVKRLLRKRGKSKPPANDPPA